METTENICPPVCLGNENLKAIVKKGDELNEMDKQQNCNIVCRMTQAVVDKEQKETPQDIFKAMLQTSAHLTVEWEGSLENNLQLQLNKYELASFATRIFFTASNTKDIHMRCAGI